MQIKYLYSKYKEIIPYVIFGVLTTIINIVTYYVMAHYFNITIMASTVFAWFLAVLFAYVTNRRWVFRSSADTMLAFFSCRIATGIVDWACMLIFVDVLQFNDVAIKIMANTLVIILNYIASKLLIFKRRGK